MPEGGEGGGGGEGDRGGGEGREGTDTILDLPGVRPGSNQSHAPTLAGPFSYTLKIDA